jgi:hypothetical protein
LFVTVAVVISVFALATPPASGDTVAASPSAPRSASSVVSIAAGYRHTCVVLDGGRVSCWGYSLVGQLGNGRTDHIGDEPGEMGRNLTPVNLGRGRTATALTAGAGHTCALLDNEAVKCWGSGYSGQLGTGRRDTIGDEPGEMGKNLARVDLGRGRTATAIAAGFVHTCALLDNRAVTCWGGGYDGQLGNGGRDDIGDQPGEMGRNLAPVDLGTGRTAHAISAGGFHTCALLDDGTVKCWGAGYDGQLGNGSTDGVGHQPGEMGDNLAPVDLGTGRTATAISARDDQTCALLDDNTVTCWGDGQGGRLGNGGTAKIGDGPGEMGDNLAPVDLGTGRTATAISAGVDHTCALLDNKTVKCWGSGRKGALGQGSRGHIGDRPGETGNNLTPIDLGTGRRATAITTGNGYTCAVLGNRTVKCWGDGLEGRLGNGRTAKIGDGPGEMGDNLRPVRLG